MKAIILAAGQGTRLRPLTNNKPKCMVSYLDNPIIDTIIKTMKLSRIKDISIVAGYKKEVLQKHLLNEKIKFYTNDSFMTTNMVSTLFCAEIEMNDDIIISYSDIIYSEKILNSLIESKDDISVVVDRSWRELWQQRMDNPLLDAETLKIKDNKIIELGKKPKCFSEIEGQYIGLIKISKKVILDVLSAYTTMDRDKKYDGKDFDNMYLTSFIQYLINNGFRISPVFINGGWTEIDCLKDLNVSIIEG